jgi:putative flippase GtrA
MHEPVRPIRFLLYAAAGAAGTAAHYAVLVTAVSMQWLAPVGASMCGAVVGAGVNFLLNARLTFRTRASWAAARRFAATASVAAAANGMAMSQLTQRLHAPYMAAQVLVTASLLALTFSINSLWTFRSEARQDPSRR